ncbi:penicillin acyltransferase [Nocardioides eburneiflavus]|uniref:Penicillin acyltransferase n=1 Tax=Nocardioides eburneiflavus TaxID=2518372 RepID=A0A4Z1CMT2_9ACTN|nr:C45 family peptidase [Nocardioides eburneiflavus]TGN65759.1 penicillin acyltransferase [Nocardioides eburneiflavus]
MDTIAPARARLHVEATHSDRFERGRLRGEQLREDFAAAFDTYLQLFAQVGITESEARDHALRSADAVGEWRHGCIDEMGGVAAGAGVDPWQVYALNARTEILATSSRALPGECSTIAHRRTEGDGVQTFSVQTWDWHVELDQYWHTHETRGGAHDVVGLAEHGMLGKIGMNSAGLATHFNILGHHTDTVGGVPVHVLAATVLEEAGSVAEAVEIIRSAPVSASSALTLLDEDSVTSVEIAGFGVWPIEPVNGTVVRTNHFLHPQPRDGERGELYQPDSTDRYELVRSRLGYYPAPRQSDDLPTYLYSDPGQPALCHIPDMTLSLGERWGTLATVVMEPSTRSARIAAGTPITARAAGWRDLVA